MSASGRADGGGRATAAARRAGRKARGPVRYLLVAAGFICVGLGVAGIFVPLLPTTPFLLLAAACFLRSSDRFYAWLMNNRWVGGRLRSYMEHRATTMSTKVGSIIMLWCCLGLAAVLFTESWAIRALLLVVGAGVTVHLATLKTIRRTKTADAHWAGASGKGGRHGREEEADDEPGEAGRQ